VGGIFLAKFLFRFVKNAKITRIGQKIELFQKIWKIFGGTKNILAELRLKNTAL
jgi:hypothetical protein